MAQLLEDRVYFEAVLVSESRSSMFAAEAFLWRGLRPS